MKVFESVFSESDILEISPIIKKGELGFGENVSLFENQFKTFSQQEYNIAVNSASAAAYMIFDYLKIEFGPCDVYMPTLGFASPAWAAKRHGHNLFFVDVDQTLLFDSDSYFKIRKENEDKGKKTVVMPILYGGVSSIPNLRLNGDEIVVIDSAHCVTPTIDSDFTFFSFHPYKPICSSDGGLISTDKKNASTFFKSYRNFGRLNKEDTYDITQDGFKFYMNNLNATIALQSLKKYNNLLEDRKFNFNKLKNRSRNLSDFLFDSEVLSHDRHSSYYFATAISNQASKIKKYYPTQTHYPLLHKTQYFKSRQALQNSENLFNKIVNIPLYKDPEDVSK